MGTLDRVADRGVTHFGRVDHRRGCRRQGTDADVPWRLMQATGVWPLERLLELVFGNRSSIDHERERDE